MEKSNTNPSEPPPPAKPSYLQAGISAISPWSSRSATPKAGVRETEEQVASAAEPGLGAQRGGDHTVHHRHRLSLRKYPRDTPPLNVLWFHAVDVPKRKNLPHGETPPRTEKLVLPKKWNPFSAGDSRALEATFQKLSDEAEAVERQKLGLPRGEGGEDNHVYGQRRPEIKDRQVQWETDNQEQIVKAKVPVNEDFLFDVDVEERELGPAYWSGPIYEVRRGTWFYQESSSVLRPCDENLATQLEEGYLKVTPWRFAEEQRQRSMSQPPKSRPQSWQPGEDSKQIKKGAFANVITPKTSSGNLRGEQASGSPSSKDQDSPKQPPAPTTQEHPKTHRLFGAHMNSVVTYQDKNTAWLLTDDFLSRMSSTMYQRFAGGGHFAGVKLHRGWADLKAKKEEAKDGKGKAAAAGSAKDAKDGDAEGKPQGLTKRGTDMSEPSPDSPADGEAPLSPSETRRQDLERQMSNLMASAQIEDPEKQEEEVRRRAEKEIQDDYKDMEGDEQGREIEHLLLVTHGIGQRLGLRMESVNFVHDVNTLRKTLKGVYGSSADLQALNNEVDQLPKNCRVQVLPIVWRHLLDFPKQSLRHNRKEHDLGDAHYAEDDEYPNLDDITVEGVPAVRNLITDLALDILLYQSPAYKGHISRIVRQECNRIYHLFKERNPNFNGKVSLVGHSLGSAIMFDLLCRQREGKKNTHRERHGHHHKPTDDALKLDFEVEDFYALGSPIGLFQMLKGRRIAARNTYNGVPPDTPLATDDPFLDSSTAGASTTSVKENHFEITTSSPKCQRVFNIFHPTDPISYRLEPLISPAMSALKPQPLPYTKKGIFGAPVGQGLTGIGARVGQSVSGLWSSFSSGIASSLLNRSLGLSADDQSKLGNPVPGQQSRVPLSVGVGATTLAGVPQPTTTTPPDAEPVSEDRKRKLAQDGIQDGDVGEHPPTLIDSEIETLFSGFQKRRKSQQSEGGLEEQAEWAEMEERSRRLRREESKVRALNGNGRVDYSIQEGAFDISLLASIASHLSYYADEDVSHFMISQLLARHRIIKKAKSSPDFASMGH